MMRFSAIAVCIVACLVSPAVSTPSYRVIDLGVASNSTIVDMNESGQILSTTYFNSVAHAVIYNRDGTRTDLGTLGREESYACAINDNGQVVGYSINWQDLGGGSRTGAPVPFLYDPATGALDYPSPVGVGTLYDITNSGAIAAGLRSPDGYGHAYYYASGSTTPQDLGTFTSHWSRATLINERGDIAGVYGGSSAFFLGVGAQWVKITSPDGGSVIPIAMNNLGQVVGDIFPDDSFKAFFWDPISGFTEIDVAGKNAQPCDINDRGQVVGAGSFTPDWDYRSFLWEKDKGVIDLQKAIDDPTWFLSSGASAINNSGWISLTAHRYGQSTYHMLLLEPVPEPSALITLICGTGVVLRPRRRR